MIIRNNLKQFDMFSLTQVNSNNKVCVRILKNSRIITAQLSSIKVFITISLLNYKVNYVITICLILVLRFTFNNICYAEGFPLPTILWQDDDNISHWEKVFNYNSIPDWRHNNSMDHLSSSTSVSDNDSNSGYVSSSSSSSQSSSTSTPLNHPPVIPPSASLPTESNEPTEALDNPVGPKALYEGLLNSASLRPKFHPLVVNILEYLSKDNINDYNTIFGGFRDAKIKVDYEEIFKQLNEIVSKTQDKPLMEVFAHYITLNSMHKMSCDITFSDKAASWFFKDEYQENLLKLSKVHEIPL